MQFDPIIIKRKLFGKFVSLLQPPLRLPPSRTWLMGPSFSSQRSIVQMKACRCTPLWPSDVRVNEWFQVARHVPVKPISVERAPQRYAGGGLEPQTWRNIWGLSGLRKSSTRKDWLLGWRWTLLKQGGGAADTASGSGRSPAVSRGLSAPNPLGHHRSERRQICALNLRNIFLDLLIFMVQRWNVHPETWRLWFQIHADLIAKLQKMAQIHNLAFKTCYFIIHIFGIFFWNNINDY